MKNTIINGDCLEVMRGIPTASIDMILCDLPYGVLSRNNKSATWDVVIPFEPLWEQYERIIKDNGAICLFAQGMFTAQLMMSKPSLWRYNLIWDKVNRPTGFLDANRKPLRIHEDICVFYKKQPTYNPQFVEGQVNHKRGGQEMALIMQKMDATLILSRQRRLSQHKNTQRRLFHVRKNTRSFITKRKSLYRYANGLYAHLRILEIRYLTTLAEAVLPVSLQYGKNGITSGLRETPTTMKLHPRECSKKQVS